MAAGEAEDSRSAADEVEVARVKGSAPDSWRPAVRPAAAIAASRKKIQSIAEWPSATLLNSSPEWSKMTPAGMS
ncbi:hypothetical protein Caci_4091 [Catenulispora acidiphila DSM 44928]|uniref:Uncharacterized protein n=1 Tax=Catenulispora acidiphila (strain DSM 44928 / JCM 14897 / NBRC 102108 / NRRL B-24433 / ID139908) TaxID=479433 RepID=C7QGB1_CATAD|nr:hypothetical protein [Catenulispora acidiphila]ACU72956.1 hypothetical protein Caci_4091 [Catenulispora acidiphila DSM 44928]